MHNLLSYLGLQFLLASGLISPGVFRKLMKASLKTSVSFMSLVPNHSSWSISNHLLTPSRRWHSVLSALLQPLSAVCYNKIYPSNYTVSSVIFHLIQSCLQKLYSDTGSLTLSPSNTTRTSGIEHQSSRSSPKVFSHHVVPVLRPRWHEKRRSPLKSVRDQWGSMSRHSQVLPGGLRHHSLYRFHV